MMARSFFSRILTAAALFFVGCGQSADPQVMLALDNGATATNAGNKQEPRENRLAKESSPYLLLHAHNPVDWYPWGEEAFAKAKKENKPIFLSIGYSSCYWCHVMERMVFENEKIAKYMNAHFVNVKVDREERPDVDDIYMTSLIVYLQMIGSREGGGWPLSMFLTPAGKPIAGGTYFPPEDKLGRPGFQKVCGILHKAWTDNQAGVEQNAEIITKEVQRLMRPGLSIKRVPLNGSLYTDAVNAVFESYDAQHGGVDFNAESPSSPKFPVPVKLSLLQSATDGGERPEIAKALDHTLDEIARGGIHDHLAGGFHRYSTDRKWHVPHFEKMLYDQAQLADVYVTAYRRTNNTLFRERAEGIYDFVLREMTTGEGAFHSALDAETDGIEGKYYVWTAEEVEKFLGPASAKVFNAAYGLNEPKNFEHGYVLHIPVALEETAAKLKMSASELESQLAPMRRKLLTARKERKPLLEDDKILTSWNGLMIRSLAHAGQKLGRQDYVDAAVKSAMFVLTRMRDSEGRLNRTHRNGVSKLNAYLDDYAFFIEGLLAIHSATEDEKWLNAARRLTDDQIKLFWDEKGYGFFFTSHGHEELIARTKNASDTVIPSGNSVAVRNLIRLSNLTREKSYGEKARQTLELFAPALERRPRGMANMALALAEFLESPQLAAQVSQADGEKPKESEILLVAAESTADEKKKAILTARAYLDVDRLPAGGTCRIVVYADIKEPWHINSNPPKPKNMKATKLSVSSSQKITLKDVRYPKGKPFTIEGFDEPISVYEKRVVMRGTLVIPAEAAPGADEVTISIRYQACNDKQCLGPKTAKLVGKVPIAKAGERVRSINKNLFPPTP